MGRKFRKKDPFADASASGAALFGRDRGKDPRRRLGDRTSSPTFGPAAVSPHVAGPLGYGFRNIESFQDNADRIQFMFVAKKFDIRSIHNNAENGSVVPEYSTLQWMTDHFWADIYPNMWNKAQRRDGYRSLVATLNTPLMPVYYTNLAVAISINVRVLQTIKNSLLVNQALRTCLAAFEGLEGIIDTCVEESSRLIYPAALTPLVEYWSTVYSSYPGGPIVANYFDYQDTEDYWPAAVGTFTAWASALPNLNVAADVEAMIADNLLALSILLDYNVTAGNNLDDQTNYLSLADMLGIGAQNPSTPALTTDVQKWIEQWQVGAFTFLDSKGLGTDTFIGSPDIRGSEESLININPMGLSFPEGDLFWVGGKGLYAFEFDDDDTPCYTAAANDITGFGMVAPSYLNGDEVIAVIVDIYNREDGWVILPATLDFTDAAGLQSYLWSAPHITVHPESWRVIMSEEAEEAYRHNLLNPGFQMPFDIFGQVLKKFAIEAWDLPFVV